LRRLAGRLGIADRVSFEGEVADARAHIASAEVLLLSSTYEGYPAVVVEALAAGTYVVASACSPALVDLLDSPLLGRIVKSRRPEGYAQAIQAFLGSPDRTASAMRMARALPRVQSHIADLAAWRHLQCMGLLEPQSAAHGAAARAPVGRVGAVADLATRT